MNREERLIGIEVRAERKVRSLRVMALIAQGFGNDAKANAYTEAARTFARLQRAAWLARVEAGTRRWAFDDARQVATVVEA